MNLISRGRFFLPGPTEVHPDVMEAQTRAIISHRSPQMASLLSGVQVGLRQALGTERPVIISTSSATGLMEAGVRSVGVERILCVVGGAFSARFARIASQSGLKVDVLEVPWGSAHDPEALAQRVAEVNPELVTMVHSETSTGVLNPVAELTAAVRRRSKAFVVVDSVSGAGGVAVHADEWGADLLLTGSQKAFALPPGLSFGVVSDRLAARVAASTARGFYFDLSAHVTAAVEHRSLTTPPITLLYALEVQLQRMGDEGLDRRFRRHAEMAQDCYRWIDDLQARGVDVAIAAPDDARSPTVTAVRLPPGQPSSAIIDRLATAGYVIAPGYGPWKDDYIRLGHMGDHERAGFQGLLGALGDVLLETRGAFTG